MKKICIALGGNALQRVGDKGSAEEMLTQIDGTCRHCMRLLEDGYHVIMTHGNGPQVGNIFLQNEYSKERLPPMPLDICGAESQGMIGYLLQQQLRNHMHRHQITMDVVTLCTQTLVDAHDPAFLNPTKPIGPFYTEQEAKKLEKSQGWKMMEQKGKGFRRVVPSPLPVSIVESEIIQELSAKHFVIACGGGGIPVIKNKQGQLQGIEAVIDKDRTAAVLGRSVGCEILMILTDVEKVALHFGTPQQKNLSHLTVQEVQQYSQSGEFGVGSMAPKVEAARDFVLKGGAKAIITSLDKVVEALHGNAGTVVTK